MSRATAAFADAMESCAGYVQLSFNHPIYLSRIPGTAKTHQCPSFPLLQDEGSLIRTGNPYASRSRAALSDGQSLACSGKEIDAIPSPSLLQSPRLSVFIYDSPKH